MKKEIVETSNYVNVAVGGDKKKAEFEKYFKTHPETPRKKGRGASKQNDKKREDKINSQLKLPPVDPEKVEEMVKNFLMKIGVELGYKISNKGDFVWIKFTEDNFVGVVAKGCDFNFKDSNRSGRYLKKINKKWNKKLLLVFPISKYPEGKTISMIERAVGNYLIDEGIPIIDFYSHNY